MRILLSLLLAASLSFGFSSGDQPVDLSSPQNACNALLKAMQADETEKVERISTETGIEALEGLAASQRFAGLNDLASEVDPAAIHWDEITDEIFLARAETANHVHKLQFVREAEEWLLYHWTVLDRES